MGGKMSRDKGKRGEREVIELLQPVVDEVRGLFGLPALKLKRNTLQSDSGGSDIAGLMWLALECKWQETIQLGAWWKQTLEQCGPEQEPVLFYKRNHVDFRVGMLGWLGTRHCGHTTMVVVSVEDFLKWFRLRLMQQYEMETGRVAA
jgi:hypothetical protein